MLSGSRVSEIGTVEVELACEDAFREAAAGSVPRVDAVEPDAAAVEEGAAELSNELSRPLVVITAPSPADRVAGPGPANAAAWWW